MYLSSDVIKSILSSCGADLSVFDYIKIQTYQIINKSAIKETAQNASNLAEKEGLFAHKLAAEARLK